MRKAFVALMLGTGLYVFLSFYQPMVEAVSVPDAQQTSLPFISSDSIVLQN